MALEIPTVFGIRKSAQNALNTYIVYSLPFGSEMLQGREYYFSLKLFGFNAT